MLAGIQQKPVGVFWDIENCSVAKNKSPSDVIAYIRNFFVLNRLNHREYEFVIPCDVTRLRKDVPEDINKAGGVTLSHVNGSSKNAADEKLRENMKKFVDTHASYTSPVLILISGDVDFVNDLRGYQTRLGCTVVLIHAANCSSQFKIGWNEIYPFESFCSAVKDNPAVNAAEDAKRKQQNSRNRNGQQNQSGQPNVKNQGGQQPNPKNQPDQKPFRPNQPGNTADKTRRPAQSNQKTKTKNLTYDVPPSHQSGNPNQHGQHFPHPLQNHSQPFPVPGQHQTHNFSIPPPHYGQSMFDASQYQGQPIPVPWQQPGQAVPAPWQQPGQPIPLPWQQPGQPIPVPWQHPGQPSPVPSQQIGQPIPVPWQHPGQPIPVTWQHPGQPIPAPWQQPGQPIPAPQQHQRQAIPVPSQHKGPQFHHGNRNIQPNIQQLQPLMDIKLPAVPATDKPAAKNFILMVVGLPGKMDFKILRENLQSEASKVHGRVKYVKNGQAFITFKNKANADRAVDLFNGKEVFGKTVRVSFAKSIPYENEKPKSDFSGLELAKKADPAGASQPEKIDATDDSNTADNNQPLSGMNGDLNNDPVIAGLESIIDGILTKRVDNKNPDSCSIH